MTEQKSAGQARNGDAFGTVFHFNEVFRAEIEVIKKRRKENHDTRGELGLEKENPQNHAVDAALRPNEEAALVGLALSGGGIRSAAFCLGALQALDVMNVLGRVDYLSTVSGGGYIGCSMSAGMESTKGKFPFANRLEEDETPAVQHVRDYSNYLFPEGPKDFMLNAAICGRGLVANVVLVTPFLLIAAILTLISYPTPGSMKLPSLLGIPVPNAFGLPYFVLTVYLLLILLVATIGWGLYQSNLQRQPEKEIPSTPVKIAGGLVIVLFVCAFCELQPLVLVTMLQPKGISVQVSEWINSLLAIFTPVAAAIAFLATKLAEFIKSSTESSRKRSQIAGYVARVAVYVAAIIVPLLLWVVYLNITILGLCINAPSTCSLPKWLGTFAYFITSWVGAPAAVLYFVIALVFFLLSRVLRPNANSLHPLYRDRLAKAFLFEPEAKLEKDKELPLFVPQLSELSGKYGPYHLINTALNIQNSKTANRRGRNADFFCFSSKFVGSKTTGYVATQDMEAVMPGLNLKSAMAASGAAASSNMGTQTIKPLTPTLALLNMRLGYWLRNPSHVKKRGGWNKAANFYFLLECFGLLNEKKKSVYLTDGGHIENLGIYELLKRRCKVIIAVDAEADREMAFGSLNTVERYARIDLGIGIDLAWQKIADVSRATGKDIDEKGDAEKQSGPHCAVGEISYPGNHKGILIYIKSSLTGDENDYVFHYKKRYEDFPHETTLDQMFSEEQFEAYRALGFHAAFRFFDRRDAFAYLDPVTRRHARSEIAYLDKLFPRPSDQKSPQSKLSFAAWLPPANPMS